MGSDLRVTTPNRRTSSGRLGSAKRDAILNQHLAWSRSVPSANVTVRSDAPVAGRLARHVEHVVDSVDLLLDRAATVSATVFGRGARKRR